MGRFLSHDIVYDTDAGLQGYNLFVYCGNDPIGRLDILGADSEKNPDLDIVDDDEELYGNGGTVGCSNSPRGRVSPNTSIYPKGATPRGKINIAARGSTAQKQPTNLTEQLALEQVTSNPQGKAIPVTMNDPRWPAAEGWLKMQQTVFTSQGNINVHYNYNPYLNLYDDFKLK